MTATYSATSTDLTSFNLSDASSDRLAGDLPPEPDYDKQRWGLSLDLPVNDRLRLLAGYNHSSSEVVYQRSDNYGGGLFGQSSTSENCRGGTIAIGDRYASARAGRRTADAAQGRRRLRLRCRRYRFRFQQWQQAINRIARTGRPDRHGLRPGVRVCGGRNGGSSRGRLRCRCPRVEQLDRNNRIRNA